MSKPFVFLLRPMRESDRAFVVSTWLNSDKHASSVSRAVHRVEHGKLIDHILARQETCTTVAYPIEDEDALLGWACTAPTAGVIYYVYVRGGKDHSARRLGIARALLGDMSDRHDIIYTHRPVIHGKLVLPEGWAFNPYRNWTI